MAVQKSQSYRVDNRYSEAQGVQDNTSSLLFLRKYLERGKNQARFPVTLERLEDDRFIMPALGGTVPVGAFPYEPRGSANISNTDRSASFRNTFRATPS
jgi:hypothetical protein